MTTESDNSQVGPLPHGKMRGLIEAHFALKITAARERTLREHLPLCPDCRAYYDRNLQLAGIDPKAARPMERLGVALGVRPRAIGGTAWTLATGTAFAMAAIAFFLIPRATQQNAQVAQATAVPSGFAARGSDNESAGISVYRIDAQDHGMVVAPGENLPSDAELAFAYRNPTARARLLVFAVDSAGAIHWYFPAWTDPAVSPEGIPIEAATSPKRLPDAIRHPLAKGAMWVHAIFTDQPLTVREVESRLTSPGTNRARLGLDPRDIEWSGEFEVR